MADEYISRKAAMEYLYRAINADPDGNCPSCVHDEHDCQYDRCWTLMDFCEKIEYLGYVPAADAVPVVRCKYCVYYDTVGCSDGFGWCEGTMVNTSTHDNFFCAEGKKKENA